MGGYLDLARRAATREERRETAESQIPSRGSHSRPGLTGLQAQHLHKNWLVPSRPGPPKAPNSFWAP